ncbi:hypothetical protein QBC34DRAFT_439141 [Podospora aff. communis PSN243]|uniref:BTB domain-containing protein n=1 Tax=Podospora aff. communis PSN243 TaxID=3040156 RepID=A0AAV9GLS6_9PEZI|nr:hypothetical protein QBC34DRAFT_439141 [Podospora aff. communis PSN243]
MGLQFAESPFRASAIVNIKFKDNAATHSIHRIMLEKAPKLCALAPKPKTPATFQLPLPQKVGHVLINYLYLNTYESGELIDRGGGPIGAEDETIAKFKLAFGVYAAARQYDIDGLERPAKDQITLLSETLNAFTIIDIIVVTKALIPAPSLTLAGSGQPHSESEESASTANAVLRCALDAFREILQIARPQLPLKKSTVVRTANPAKFEPPVAAPEPPKPTQSETVGQLAPPTNRPFSYAAGPLSQDSPSTNNTALVTHPSAPVSTPQNPETSLVLRQASPETTNGTLAVSSPKPFIFTRGSSVDAPPKQKSPDTTNATLAAPMPNLFIFTRGSSVDGPAKQDTPGIRSSIHAVSSIEPCAAPQVHSGTPAVS